MKIYRLPRQFKVSNTPISFKWKRQIKEIIQKEKPDVINAHSPVPFISDVTCRIAHELKIPFVLTYHASSLYKKGFSVFNGPIYLYKLFFEKRMFNKSSNIIAVSDFSKLQFPKRVQRKIKIIYNAIEDSKIKKVDTKTILEDNLIFLGSLNKSHDLKGLSKIIFAIREYINKFNKEIKLIVVGNGDYKHYYEKLVEKLNLQRKVIFLGAKFGEKKKNILNWSKILITYPDGPYDAFPTVFLEAWANNIPIIASNIGTIPYLIKDKVDGFLVESNNPKELAKGIHELLKNKGLQDKIIKNGNKKVKENFTWDISTKKMNKVIQEVLR